MSDKTVVNEVNDEIVVEEPVTVSLKDVKLMLTVIDVVSRRGGFSPGDFKVVGELFDKLNIYIKK